MAPKKKEEAEDTQPPVEQKSTEKQRIWEERLRVSLIIGSIVVGLDIIALLLGTIVDEIPVAFSIGCIGIVTFIGVLAVTNYLSHDPALAKREMRKAIAASVVITYFVLLATVVLDDDEWVANSELAETVVKHFTWVVGIVVSFYFSTRIIDDLRKKKRSGDEED